LCFKEWEKLISFDLLLQCIYTIDMVNRKPTKKRKKRKKYMFFRRYLDDGERIMSVVHRHILVFKIAAAKSGFFGLIMPLGLYWLFPRLAIVSIAWAMIGFFVVMYHFVDWYSDVWVLTNMGVIDLERNGFFDMTSTRIDYHMMEGISYQIKGVVRTLFNYGEITIDKLGSKTSVILKDAAGPKRVERLVMKYQEEFVNNKSVQDHYALKDMLSNMIAYHVQSKKIKTK
jgi:hypothetical protein